jgi:hypothetical protein
MTIKSATIPATQVSAAATQSAGYHPYPSQYDISICSRHDKLLAVSSAGPFFLLEGVGCLFFAIICHGNGKTILYLSI